MLVRIISAFIGIAIGVTVLIVDNNYLYMGILSIIGCIGVYEIIRAVKCETHKVLLWFCVVFSIGVPFALNIGILRRFWVSLYLIFVIILLIIMLAQHKTVKLVDITACGSAALVIPAALSCIIFVRNLSWYAEGGYFPGTFMIVYMLFCAWFGDSGAYFVGTFMGKHKLCPDISPKKTVEGVIGGVITVGLATGVQCVVYNLLLPTTMKMNYFVLIPVAMAASVVGVLGDLSASVIKRQYDVKDFGNLMPGHGGVLDRFDSVIFVAPFLYAVFSFVNPIMQ